MESGAALQQGTSYAALRLKRDATSLDVLSTGY